MPTPLTWNLLAPIALSDDTTNLRTAVIYCAKFKVDGRKYIGQTIIPVARRRYFHEYAARAEHPKTHFHRALKCYGKESFEWEIIAGDLSLLEVDAAERFFIAFYRANDPIHGFNTEKGGRQTHDRYSLETRARMSEHKRKKRIPLSESHKESIRVALKGKKKSAAHVKMMSEAAKRRAPRISSWNKGLNKNIDPRLIRKKNRPK